MAGLTESQKVSMAGVPQPQGAAACDVICVLTLPHVENGLSWLMGDWTDICFLEGTLWMLSARSDVYEMTADQPGTYSKGINLGVHCRGTHLLWRRKQWQD